MADRREIVHLSSLLASRLCHDLVNPVGALQTGLDVFGEDTDPEMQAHAIALIKESTQKTIDILSFARMAFGSSGGWEGDLDMGEAGKLSEAYYNHAKATLIWDLPPQPLPKPLVRTLMNLVLMVERCAPRAGSEVRVFGELPTFTIAATGPKLKYSEAFADALTGDFAELAAKETPAALAALLAEAAGLTIDVDAGEEHLTLRISAE